MAIVAVPDSSAATSIHRCPDLSGVELEELTTSARSRRRGHYFAVPMAEIDRELAVQRKAQRVAMSSSLIRALWWLIFQDVGRIPKTWARRGWLRSSASIARVARICAARRSNDRDRAPPSRRAESAIAHTRGRKSTFRSRCSDRLRSRAHLDFVVPCSLVMSSR
jgi:hypothetical protein